MPRGSEASAIYSIVITAKPNGLNQRAFLEWLLTEIPNDQRLGEPGHIDRYLTWSGDGPDFCRFTTVRVDEEAALTDAPIVDASALEVLPDNSCRSANVAWKVVGSFQTPFWIAVGSFQETGLVGVVLLQVARNFLRFIANR